MECRRQPAHEFRVGRIKAKIWANETPTQATWFNVEIVRLYKDEQTWCESTRFGHDDLPLVAKATDMAYAWVWEQKTSADTE